MQQNYISGSLASLEQNAADECKEVELKDIDKSAHSRSLLTASASDDGDVSQQPSSSENCTFLSGLTCQGIPYRALH